jgi:HJR/Mrr/RecB family endonuclease
MTLGSVPLGSAPLGGGVDLHVTFELQPRKHETAILEVARRIDEALIRRFSNNPEQLKVMDRRLFEELIAELFNGFGYEVELTRRTRDGGKDVIAIRQAEVNVRYLIECKRPDPGTVVGVAAVRELLGVKTDERATKGILATTAYFSHDAQLLFHQHAWELEPRDYNAVVEWIRLYLNGRAAG